MILPYRGKGNLLVNGCPCGVESAAALGRQRKGHRDPPHHPTCSYRYGDPPRAPARLRWAGAVAASGKVMEMHVVRRPVYGGAAQQPPA